MGTLNWTLTPYAKDNNKNCASSAIVASGAYTSSVTVGNVTGAVAKAGQVFYATAEQATWVNFGGSNAAVGTGHYFPANIPIAIEIDPTDEGQITAIEA